MADDTARGDGGRPATIDELVALTEEIAALARAGSPLEAGLGRAGEELPGRIGGLAESLAGRMRDGASLPDALAAEGVAIPPLYRAVVEAGARSGDLPAALAGVSRYLRGFAEARESVGLALWYPLIVATVAYALFVALMVAFAPRLASAFESLGLATPRAMALVERVGGTAWLWWPIWPIALILLAIAWVRSGRAARFDGRSWSLLSLFPWMRSLVRDHRSAGFAELLALLLENRVAYPKAVTLAAEATGDARLIAEARGVAADLERGRSAEQAVSGGGFRSLSPMLRWALAHGTAEGSVPRALRNLAPMYRSRAASSAVKLRVLLPSLIVATVGAAAVLLYALTVFAPLSGLLDELAGP
ncbi:type II secretion system F family protein [Paludisphaera sp.]|uniref:type II secretion system F family protein n=1 Tax=Paludisphaera sp. TaxID=2017432 RepID=UPI00301C75B5